jgi:hypothetical protein
MFTAGEGMNVSDLTLIFIDPALKQSPIFLGALQKRTESFINIIFLYHQNAIVQVGTEIIRVIG